jgi:hypothetical protein
MDTPKTNKFISRLTAVLVFALAVGAFVLSYAALRDLAAHNGLSDWRAYLWPLMLDAALVVCSLAVLRANLQSDRAVYPWFLVGLYTLATIAFNVAHAPTDTMGRLVAVVAPLSLFLSFELFVSMLRSEVKHYNALQALKDIQEQIKDAEGRKAGLNTQIWVLETNRDTLQETLKALQKEKRNLSFEITQETVDRAKAILAERPAIEGSELGRMLGRSDSLGRRIKKALASPNGSGPK